MRVLEARFYPQQRVVDDFVVVGRVVWEGDGMTGQPTVQPSKSLMTMGTPATMLSKLQYLVEVTAPEAFDRLQALKSHFWSFVDVSSSAQGGA
jgi:hypothetical protein